MAAAVEGELHQQTATGSRPERDAPAAAAWAPYIVVAVVTLALAVAERG